jgi:hypothetical protein
MTFLVENYELSLKVSNELEWPSTDRQGTIVLQRILNNIICFDHYTEVVHVANTEGNHILY